jgi:CBS domain-containing protein
MASLGVDYLVVVEGERLAGILTRVDVERVLGGEGRRGGQNDHGA